MAKVALSAKFVEAAPPGDYFDTFSPGLTLRVSPRRKSWSLTYTLPGTRKRTRLHLGAFPKMTLAKARKAAGAVRDELDQGIDPRPAEAAQDVAPLTVAGLVENFLRLHAKPNLRSGKNIELRLRKNVLSIIGHVPLADLHQRHVNQVVDSVIARGAAIEANRTYENLRAAVAWGVRRGDLDSSPFARMRKPSPENTRERTLSEPEIAHLWRIMPVAFRQSVACQRILRLALILGQRISEISEMEVAELDMPAALWNLPAARTKNAAAHQVPLPKLALGIIRAAIADANGSPHVFPSPEAGGIPGHAISTAVRRALVPSEGKPRGRLDMEPWRPHDLRRTCLTGLAKLGVQPVVIGGIANHLSVTRASITFAVYVTHTYEPEKRAALSLWADRLSAIIEGQAATVTAMTRKRHAEA